MEIFLLSPKCLNLDVHSQLRHCIFSACQFSQTLRLERECAPYFSDVNNEPRRQHSTVGGLRRQTPVMSLWHNYNNHSFL